MDKKKVLLIEDSIYCQTQIKESLECFPEIEIVETDTGKSALLLLEKNPKIDLMLIDIGLPDMTGLELLEKINSNHKVYLKTPKVAVTAHVMKTELDSYIGKGFTSIISKPFKLQLFREAIQSILASQKGEKI